MLVKRSIMRREGPRGFCVCATCCTAKRTSHRNCRIWSCGEHEERRTEAKRMASDRFVCAKVAIYRALFQKRNNDRIGTGKRRGRLRMFSYESSAITLPRPKHPTLTKNQRRLQKPPNETPIRILTVLFHRLGNHLSPPTQPPPPPRREQTRPTVRPLGRGST